MGMYNDFRLAQRDSWEFKYTGTQLLPYAEERYRVYTEKEKKARKAMADILMDDSKRSNGPDVAALKQEIDHSGTEREKALVWIHEFKRCPQELFALQVGDVTYFDIVKFPPES